MGWGGTTASSRGQPGGQPPWALTLPQGPDQDPGREVQICGEPDNGTICPFACLKTILSFKGSVGSFCFEKSSLKLPHKVCGRHHLSLLCRSNISLLGVSGRSRWALRLGVNHLALIFRRLISGGWRLSHLNVRAERGSCLAGWGDSSAGFGWEISTARAR